MSAIRATVITLAMLFTMIAVVTGISANSNHEEVIMPVDGYGISSHISQR